jgi:hypothetical protein
MRQRGAQFGGMGVGEGQTGNLGSSMLFITLSHSTVWSMPGGFTSAAREGYQTVDDESYNHQPTHQPRPAAPKPLAPANNQPTPGAYESV